MKRLALVVFGLVAALVILEVVAHLLGLAPVPPPDSFYALSAVAGPIPMPYDSFAYAEEGEVTHVRLNYRSLNDIDHAYQKPPGVQRIMFLGDSYTAAWQVEREENYVSRLRAWLDVLPGAYELINAGWHGWGTDRQYLYYQTEGYRYDNDLVVLQIYVNNDIADNGVGVLGEPIPDGRPYFRLGNDGALLYVPYQRIGPQYRRPVGLAEQVKAFLRHHSFLYNTLRDAWAAAHSPQHSTATAPPEPTTPDSGPAPLPVVAEVFGPADDPKWQEAFAITRQLLHALRQEVEAHGGRLAAFIVPAQYQLVPETWEHFVAYHGLSGDWDPARPAERFADWLDAEGIPYLNLAGPVGAYLEATGRRSLRYDISHWTPEGHCVVGTVVQNWLIGEGLIEGPPDYVPVDPVGRCDD